MQNAQKQKKNHDEPRKDNRSLLKILRKSDKIKSRCVMAGMFIWLVARGIKSVYTWRKNNGQFYG